MLQLRTTRPRVALHLARGYAAAAPRPEVDFEEPAAPAAESSSAPYRRAAASSSPGAVQAHQSSASEVEIPVSHESRPHPLAVPINESSQSSIRGLRVDVHGRPISSATRERKRGPARTLAYIKAKDFAKAVREAQDGPNVPPSPSATTPPSSTTANTVSSGSAAVGTSSAWRGRVETSSQPTLEDLLSKRIIQDPPPADTPRYARMYASLRDSIDNAFVLKQLVPLARELGVPVTTKESKARVMGKILAKWGWRAPVTRKKVEEDLMKVADPLPPVVEKDLEMSPAQLFLFFRDTRHITSLIDFQKVRFSIVPVTQHGSADQAEVGSIADAGTKSVLRASGSEGAIKHLVEHLDLRWKSMKTVDFTVAEVLGIRASPETLQLVSNATGAYVVAMPDDTYQAFAFNEGKARQAKRLLQMMELENTILANHRPLSAVPSRNSPPVGHRQNDFSLYPFLNALPDPLEWNVRMALGTTPTFRARRVASWSAKSTKELEHSKERVGEARPILLKEAAGSEGREANETEQMEMEQRTSLDGVVAGLIDHARESGMGLTQMPTINVSATFGYMLFPSNTPGAQGVFDNPLPGDWPITSLSTIMSIADRRPKFTSTLTPAMVHVPITTKSIRQRRVRYRCDPALDPTGSTYLACTFTYPDIQERAEETWQDQLDRMLSEASPPPAPAPTPEDEVKSEQSLSVNRPAVMEHELDGVAEEPSVAEAPEPEIGDVEVPAGQLQEGAEAYNLDETPEASLPHLRFTAEIGRIIETDILMPDRPVDMRLSAHSSWPLPIKAIPKRLNTLFVNIEHRASKLRDATVFPAPEVVHTDVGDIKRAWYLEKDEEVEIVESVLDAKLGVEARSPERSEPLASTSTLTDSIPSEVSGDAAQEPANAQVVLRNVKSTEQTLQDRPVSYTQVMVHGDSVPDAFWREVANVSREIPEGAGLRQTMRTLF